MSVLACASLLMTGIAKAQTVKPDIELHVDSEWSVYCDRSFRNDLGEIQSAKSCFIEAKSINIPHLISIDDRGLHVGLDRPDPVCDGKPARMAVDGKKIQKLPAEKQVSVMLSGGKLAATFETAWPECIEEVQSASLQQFPMVYRAMLDAWARMKFMK